MIEVLALAVVVSAGLFLVALGGASLITPSSASRFLLGFAGSPARHYAELALRFLVGGAFVLTSPQVVFAGAFSLFGWVLIATTAGLLLIPWRWHQRFARRVVPQALRFLPLVGASSLALGLLVLVAVFSGNAIQQFAQAGARQQQEGPACAGPGMRGVGLSAQAVAGATPAAWAPLGPWTTS